MIFISAVYLACVKMKLSIGYHSRNDEPLPKNLMQESQNDKPQPTLYELIGGNDKLRELVDRFYDLMDLETEFAALRAMHPPSLDGSRDKLYLFLSGWSGGPDLYTPVHGHPFLRARHLPFAIGTAERDQWLTCMLLAMRELAYSEEKQDLLLNAFFGTADWMRNKQS
ncbi:MAG: hypothetical protein RLZZ20_466 [Pseudomonadota bacterium]